MGSPASYMGSLCSPYPGRGNCSPSRQEAVRAHSCPASVAHRARHRVGRPLKVEVLFQKTRRGEGWQQEGVTVAGFFFLNTHFSFSFLAGGRGSAS